MKTISALRTRSYFARLIPTIAITGLLAAFAPFATAAGEADGTYEIKKLSASFVSDGTSIIVPKQLLKNAFIRKGGIVITDNQVPVLRKKWLDVINEFNFLGIDDSIKVTGPSSLTLESSGDEFTGSTTSPVVVKLAGTFLGSTLRMDLSATYSARLVDDTLTLTVPIRIRTLGSVTATGTVKVVAQRL